MNISRMKSSSKSKVELLLQSSCHGVITLTSSFGISSSKKSNTLQLCYFEVLGRTDVHKVIDYVSFALSFTAVASFYLKLSIAISSSDLNIGENF